MPFRPTDRLTPSGSCGGTDAAAQVIPAKRGLWNLYIEPRITVTGDGVGQSKWAGFGGISRPF